MTLKIRDREHLRAVVQDLVRLAGECDHDATVLACDSFYTAEDTLVDADFSALVGETTLPGEQDGSLLRVVQKHRRHIEMSPGVGEACQRYGIAVCDDIEMDLRHTLAAGTPDSAAFSPQTQQEGGR